MTTFKPMLAASVVPALDEINYPIMASPKLDGIRCVTPNGYICSRNMKPIPNKHVRDTLQALSVTELDGELMVDGDFNSVQSAIMSESGQPKFYYNVFDSLIEPKAKFMHRSNIAHAMVDILDSPHVRIVPQVWVDNAEQLAELWQEWLDQGYEGAIVRDPYAPYKNGRSTLKQGWMLKLKKFDDSEAEIVGMEELMHNDNAAEIGELGQTKRSSHQDCMTPGGTLGSFVCAWKGITFNLGTGFTAEQRQQYWDHGTQLSLAKFKYQGVGPKGKPRFPVFLGFRDQADL